jgi:uncharacterized coiled-coil DUF342 family protein
MRRQRDIVLQKRPTGDILPPVREDVGEPPILEEIYSQTRSAQNRQHSLALDIKRMNRVYDRVEALQTQHLKVVQERDQLKDEIAGLHSQVTKLKESNREMELELIQLKR